LFNENSWTKDVRGIKEAKVNVLQHGVARKLYKWMDKMARMDEYHLSTTDPPFSMDPIYDKSWQTLNLE